MAGGFTNPQYLVDTAWLAERLEDPDVRIFDCTVQLGLDPGNRASVESGRDGWEQGHVPGSGFLDLPGELSDRDTGLRFMMPPPEQFADALGRHGVGPGARVVLYDTATGSWAARVWWMLRAFGFDGAAVLDGGFYKWAAEGRPVSTEPSSYPSVAFKARPRPELIAGKEEVLAAIGRDGTCILNALGEEQHRGDGPATYGRAGRIPASVNVPVRGLVDPETRALLPPEELRRRFADVGAMDSGRVITYCGGGIAASGDALVLTLLGHANVAVYDGSMSEWASDPALPMETG